MPYFAPWQKTIYVSPEISAGTLTPGVAGTAIWKEECRDFQPGAGVFAEEQEKGYAGVAATAFGITRYGQYDTPSATYPLRACGVSSLYLLSLCGQGGEATTGAGPYTHTGLPSLTSALVPTFTIWEDVGDTTVSKFVQSTVSSLQIQSSWNAAVTASASFTSKYRSMVAKPTATIRVGDTTGSPNYKAETMPGSGLTYTFYDSTGTAFTAKVMSCDITIARVVDTIPGISSKDIQDIPVGELSLSGSLTFEFEGYGAHSIYDDFQNNRELGDATHKHSLAWTDSNGNTVTIKFWPVKFNGYARSDQNAYVMGTVNFMAYQNMAKAMAASPAVSTLDSIIIGNGISGNMIS